MRRNANIIPFRDFTGGEASVFPIGAMPPRFSTTLQNCHVSEKAGIAKMPGYVRVNSASIGAQLTSGFEFRRTDGTAILLAAGGGSIYKVNSNNELEAIQTGLNASARVRFAAMNNICIMANGVDPPMRYDGTLVSTLGGTPPATGFKPHVHKGRVWMLERGNKMMASHSALNNPEDWTAANDAGYIDLKYVLKKGDELLDIATYMDLLVFFFRSHVVIYSGTNPASPENFQIVQLIEGVGVIDTDLAQHAGTDLGFLSAEGVKTLRQVVTTGGMNLGDLSARIDPTIRGEMASGAAYAVGHYPRLGWLMILINDKVWVYSYTHKAWARMVGADCSGMFNTVDGRLYLCGNGFLYKYGEGYSFAGSPMEMKWETGWMTLSRDGRKFFPRLMEIGNYPGSETEIRLEMRYDYSPPQPEWYTAFSTQQSGLAIDSIEDFDAVNPLDEWMDYTTRIPLFGGGRSMQMVFSNKTDKGPIEFSSIFIQGILGNL
jgi:hypothetical protein